MFVGIIFFHVEESSDTPSFGTYFHIRCHLLDCSPAAICHWQQHGTVYWWEGSTYTYTVVPFMDRPISSVQKGTLYIGYSFFSCFSCVQRLCRGLFVLSVVIPFHICSHAVFTGLPDLTNLLFPLFGCCA